MKKRDSKKIAEIRLHSRIRRFMDSLEKVLRYEGDKAGSLVRDYIDQARRGKFLSIGDVDKFLEGAVARRKRNFFDEGDIEEARNICYGIADYNRFYFCLGRNENVLGL